MTYHDYYCVFSSLLSYHKRYIFTKYEETLFIFFQILSDVYR